MAVGNDALKASAAPYPHWLLHDRMALVHVLAFHRNCPMTAAGYFSHSPYPQISFGIFPEEGNNLINALKL